ncbi:hypothetical protein pb186bvf_017115 [Paramecium bursaria]
MIDVYQIQDHNNYNLNILNTKICNSRYKFSLKIPLILEKSLQI